MLDVRVVLVLAMLVGQVAELLKLVRVLVRLLAMFGTAASADGDCLRSSEIERSVKGRIQVGKPGKPWHRKVLRSYSFSRSCGSFPRLQFCN